MWKLIFKNLWSRRKRNGWILAELIIVTIILFALVDKAAVSIYDSALPLGYDYDRLCVVSLASNKKESKKFDAERDTRGAKIEDILSIKDRMKSFPEVENVTIATWHYINSYGGNSRQYYSGNKEKDSINVTSCIEYNIFPGHNYFETYGIKTADGSPSPEELSKMSLAPNDIIVTKSYANLFYPNENIVGKNVFYPDGDDLSESYRVVAVVEDVRYQSYERTNSVVFTPGNYNRIANKGNLIIRLKEGVDMEDFVSGIREIMNKDLKAGNIYVQSIDTYKSIIDSNEQKEGITTQRQLQISLMMFFLVNLCLGVIGTFWLQTRSRTEETGIMRSFGAKRWNIRLMLLGEGVVLATVSVVIGCLIYLQIALRDGLYKGYDSFFTLQLMDTWITHFWEHFGIISALCYVLILITVIIGIYLPARNISNINPIDALRDE